jgi:hypothetical protein
MIYFLEDLRRRVSEACAVTGSRGIRPPLCLQSERPYPSARASLYLHKAKASDQATDSEFANEPSRRPCVLGSRDVTGAAKAVDVSTPSSVRSVVEQTKGQP